MTRVVVTRASHQAAELSQELVANGFEVLELPVIEIVKPDDHGAVLRSAFERLSEYEWLVVTSVNTVEHIAPLLPKVDIKFAAIGPSTADALRAIDVEVDLVPPEYVAESLVAEFPNGTGKVLIPRAAVARDVLPDGLRSKGWSVDVVTAYKTVAAAPEAGAIERLLDADIITFTASSTVENFVESYGAETVPGTVACIGPITAATARELGLKVDVTAEEHTIPGLVRALSKL